MQEISDCKTKFVFLKWLSASTDHVHLMYRYSPSVFETLPNFCGNSKRDSHLKKKLMYMLFLAFRKEYNKLQLKRDKNLEGNFYYDYVDRYPSLAGVFRK